MKPINSKKTPIYRDAGFYLESTSKTLHTFESELSPNHEPNNYIYSRYRNPTVVAAENTIQKIEEAEWALLTQSGMSAIDTALSIFQISEDKRPWLFFSEIYGGTDSYIELVLKNRRGIHVERFYAENNSYSIEKYMELLDKIKPKLIYFEAISNPMLIVADAKRIINEAKARDIVVIIDNTFATPYLWKPLIDGADIVIHSATKYLSGHGNLTAGVLCGNNLKFMQAAIEYRKWVGHMLSPDDAHRLNSQLQTFNLRFKKQCDNAFQLAEFLNQHPCIEKVTYPGLKSHPTHTIALDLLQNKGFGAIVTFQLAGKTNDEKRQNSELFIEKLAQHYHLIPSLGDNETIFMPIDAVWGKKYPFPGTIRLSCGIEDFEELKKVFTEALNL